MPTPELYLIDGSAYIYRAYHAIRPLSTSRGLPTHAVFGFLSILRRSECKHEVQVAEQVGGVTHGGRRFGPIDVRGRRGGLLTEVLA